ncbi:hypothetical protein SUGI_0895500 [Cryptomeria japonica]|nr:hypothetical protein SUGI_0895500 [Cryptomeria japonica]
MIHHNHFNGTLPAPRSSGGSYVVGGGCVMLFLVAIALILLLCSYWNERPTDGAAQSSENDHEKNEFASSCKEKEDSVLVVMPGEENPTFLAQTASLTGAEHAVNITS